MADEQISTHDGAIPDWAYEPFEMLFKVDSGDHTFPPRMTEASVYSAMQHAGYGKIHSKQPIVFFTDRHSGKTRVRVRFEMVNLNSADSGKRNIEIVRGARNGKVLYHEYFKRSHRGPGSGSTSTRIWVRGELNRRYSQLDQLSSVIVADRDASPDEDAAC